MLVYRLFMALMLSFFVSSFVMPNNSLALDNLDHCVVTEGKFMRNVCNVLISVRYCCPGDEWYKCDRTARSRWGKNPGYQQWLRPHSGRATMACNPDVHGLRWAACAVSSEDNLGVEQGPYEWDMRSTRNLKCLEDSTLKARQRAAKAQRAADTQRSGDAPPSANAPQSEESSSRRTASHKRSAPQSTGDGLSGRWVIVDANTAKIYDEFVRTCGYGTHNEFYIKNGKVFGKTIHRGAVIYDLEMFGWKVSSTAPRTITFLDQTGLTWRYDRCR